MKQHKTLLLFFVLLAGLAIGQDFASTSSGPWEDGATWGNTSPGTAGVDFPSTNDNVLISSNHVVILQTPLVIQNLDIELNAELQCDSVLRIRGHYVNNGTNSGTAQVRLINGNDTISGTGTISTSALFRVNNGRTIIAGSNITRLNGNLRAPTNDTLINLGTLNLDGVNLNGNANCVFMNGPNATLMVSRSLLNNGTVIASSTGNQIIYNRDGAGNQSIKIPLDGYYDLQLIGSTTNSQRQVLGNFQVINNLSIDGPQLMMNDGHTVYIGGDFTMASGEFVPGTSTILLNGSATQEISGDFNIYNLTIENTGSTNITSDSVRIQNELTVSAGTLNTSGRLIVNSDASGDAAITSLGGAINGNVTVLRFIDDGPTNWRFLTSPVLGTTFEDWQESFVTSGFPGASSPSFPFVSVYSYDESVGGAQENGYVAPSDASNALGSGTGYFVWCGNGNSTNNAFTIRVTGNVNSGSVALPVSYTNNVDVNADGWCLVGNPYASAIDWNSSAWTKTNLDDAVYVWNADQSQFASYVAGIGVSGGSNRIASGQAFFVKASSASPSLIVEQDAKVSTATSFLKPRTDQTIVKLAVSEGTAVAESAVRIVADATDDFDARFDAYHLPVSDNPLALYSSLKSKHYSVNSLAVNDQKELPFFHAAPAGSARLSYHITENTGLHCLVLIDHITGKATVLSDSGALNFDNVDSTFQHRFSLRITVNGDLTKPTLCELATAVASSAKPAELRAFVAGNHIYLAGDQAAEAESYRLYGLNGTLLRSGSLHAGAIAERFELPSGIYVLELLVNGVQQRFKLSF